MTQLPEKPPADWTESLTEGQTKYFMDNQFKKDVTDYNRRYLHWDELKYRIPSAEQRKMTWAVMKLYREMRQEKVAYPPVRLVYTLIPESVKRLHAIDSYLSGNIKIHNKTIRLEPSYIINSFMEEAIASSILEGAATTRNVAKEMLKKGRNPRNVSERMVANNYETMNFIREHKDALLTPSLLLEIHRLVTKGTISDDAVGQFRTNNDIVVANPTTRVIYHTPPDFHEIVPMIDALCTFANDIGTDDDPGEDYIHPIIKGIILHYLIGYIHPFEDGNGRTARSIFYWFVISRGYWLFEYMPISRIILRSKKKYTLAYLHSEYDDMDLTYFLLYNLTCIDAARKDLLKYLEEKQTEQAATKAIVRKIPDISQREGDILRTMIEQREQYFTIREIMQQYGTVYETARTDLLHLTDLGYLTKEKRGREFVFIANEKSGFYKQEGNEGT
ncbi:Fic family protein [Methanoregula sp.]|uniref:Fic family protein n=1 Tax=Methanoregula sp. TaxID=2052170 RepID=UPI002615719F|nr:Fic family protein [Methanoregula sp.]MDD5144216.1 Fic family protein [Methanoregula sp.]